MAIFGIISAVSMIAYFLIPRKFLEVTDNRPKGGMNNALGIGTLRYGFQKLTSKEQEQYYINFNYDINKKIPKSAYPKFTTKFFTGLAIPIIPLNSQITYNERGTGMGWEFNAIPIKMNWKQVFKIYAVSYGILVVLSLLGYIVELTFLSNG
jgi:hypothetical protein